MKVKVKIKVKRKMKEEKVHERLTFMLTNVSEKLMKTYKKKKIAIFA